MVSKESAFISAKAQTDNVLDEPIHALQDER